MSLLAPRADFSLDDGFLFATLGVLGVALRMKADLAELPATEAAHAGDDDAALLALLGAIALTEQLETTLSAWAGDATPGADFASGAADFHAIEDLLR